jgi:hypothetical protein
MKKCITILLVSAICFLLIQEVFAGQKTLYWNKPTEGGTVEGYRIYWSTVSKSYSINNSIDAGNTNHETVDGLSEGKKYYFIAKAYNGAGQSPNSNEASGYVPYQCVLEDGMGPGVWYRISGSGSWTTALQPDGDMASTFSSTGATILTGFKLSASAADSSFTSLRWVYKYFLPTNTCFLVNVSTSVGTRNLIYQPIDVSSLGSSTNIYYGIGRAVNDGTWRTITRDLQKDLSAAQTGIILKKINFFGIYVYGSGKAMGIKEVIAQHN